MGMCLSTFCFIPITVGGALCGYRIPQCSVFCCHIRDYVNTKEKQKCFYATLCVLAAVSVAIGTWLYIEDSLECSRLTHRGTVCYDSYDEICVCRRYREHDNYTWVYVYSFNNTSADEASTTSSSNNNDTGTKHACFFNTTACDGTDCGQSMYGVHWPWEYQGTYCYGSAGTSNNATILPALLVGVGLGTILGLSFYIYGQRRGELQSVMPTETVVLNINIVYPADLVENEESAPVAVANEVAMRQQPMSQSTVTTTTTTTATKPTIFTQGRIV